MFKFPVSNLAGTTCLDQMLTLCNQFVSKRRGRHDDLQSAGPNSLRSPTAQAGPRNDVTPVLQLSEIELLWRLYRRQLTLAG